MAMIKAKTQYGVCVGVPGEKNTIFKGVPFAKPPVGQLRFRAPQEPDRWEGELNCFEWPADDFQNRDGTRGPGGRKQIDPHYYSEDCLYMNIWTPAETENDKLPVMFWIHGGGGNSHENHIDGEEINKRGVILVTFNYRSGYLGNFGTRKLADLDPNGSTGAYGALDILAALKWVKDNISAFGGDGHNITVFGQSAGAMSTKMLLGAAPARGLFQHAIAQSGGGTWDVDPVITKEQKMDVCEKLLDMVGWTLDDMMTRSPKEIYDTIGEAEKHLEIKQQSLSRTAVGQSMDDYVITDYYGKVIYDGGAMDIDVICGTISEEWRNFPFQIPDGIEGYNREFALAPGIAWGRRVNELGSKPIYHYFYEHMCNGKPMDHSSDMPYMFGTLDRFDYNWTEYDRIISDTIVDYWTSFAKTGNPNTNGRPVWTPFTSESPMSMYITDEKMSMADLASEPKEKKVVNFLLKHPGILSTSFFDEEPSL